MTPKGKNALGLVAEDTLGMRQDILRKIVRRIVYLPQQDSMRDTYAQQPSDLSVGLSLRNLAQLVVRPAANPQHVPMGVATPIVINDAALEQGAGGRIAPARYHRVDRRHHGSN